MSLIGSEPYKDQENTTSSSTSSNENSLSISLPSESSQTQPHASQHLSELRSGILKVS